MNAIGKRVWTFGSGKGGVGKSFLTAAMGKELARSGRSVLVVDANPISPNLHGFLGVRTPCLGMLDVLEGRVSIEEVTLPTSESGLKLISCSGDRLDGVEFVAQNLEEILKLVQKLEAEYILTDLGPGTSSDVIEFFSNAEVAVLITTPNLDSVQSAYRFLKQAVYRKIIHELGSNAYVDSSLLRLQEPECRSTPNALKNCIDLMASTDPVVASRISAVIRNYRPWLLVNMTSSRRDGEIVSKIKSTARKFLSINIRSCGTVGILDDPDNSRPAWAKSSRSNTYEGIGRVLHALQEEPGPEISSEPAPARAASPVMGFNDTLMFMGRELHIQTEDSGKKDRPITTQVFLNGRVIMSTRSEYPDSPGMKASSNLILELMRTQHFRVIRQIESRKIKLQSDQHRN